VSFYRWWSVQHEYYLCIITEDDPRKGQEIVGVTVKQNFNHVELLLSAVVKSLSEKCLLHKYSLCSKISQLSLGIPDPSKSRTYCPKPRKNSSVNITNMAQLLNFGVTLNIFTADIV
jgi:hypothetical protein